MSNSPIPLILFCPKCQERHIDGDGMRPHRTHACQHCGFLWAPATVETVGVEFLPGCKNEPEVADPLEGETDHNGVDFVRAFKEFAGMVDLSDDEKSYRKQVLREILNVVGAEKIVVIPAEDRPRALNMLVRRWFGTGLGDVLTAKPHYSDTPDGRQERIGTWVRETFGDEALAPKERISRILEEAFELAQAEDFDEFEAVEILHHVYGKPKGESAQELGGLRVCILAYAASRGLSADKCEWQEIDRILAIPADEFRRRHQVKVDAGVAAQGIRAVDDAEKQRREEAGECADCTTAVCDECDCQAPDNRSAEQIITAMAEDNPDAVMAALDIIPVEDAAGEAESETMRAHRKRKFKCDCLAAEGQLHDPNCASLKVD